MESTPEEVAEGLAIVRVLAAVLDRLVCANTPMARAEPHNVTKFHALKAPGIGIQQYLERIHKYASCSNQCFILALIYIDRLIQRNNFLLTELNVHRVIVTAVLLAAKFFDDAYYNNAYYAKVGGVLVSEMNGLEVDFLFRINFSLHVTPELFEQYRIELLSHAGTDSLPLPPPQPPLFNVEQQLVALTQSEALPLQPQQMPLGNAGLNFPIPSVPAPVSAPPQITPSPPRAPAASTAAAVTLQVAANAMFPIKTVQDSMVVDQNTSLRSNLPNLFPHEFGFLQRANSLPLQPKSLGVEPPQNNQPALPLSAPPMIPMVPGATAAAADQFVVVDNQLYQLPGGLVLPNHGVAAAASTSTASDLIHHVHHPTAAATAHHHNVVPGFASTEAAVAQQRFQQMVAGVSGL